MSCAFKNIAIVARPMSDAVIETLRALIHFLEQTKRYKLIIEEKTATLLSDNNVNATVKSARELADEAEVIVVVGGDGSLLYGAHMAVLQQLPIIGINRGYLGFLSDIHPDNLALLDRVLSGEYITENRSLLDVQVVDNHQTIYQAIALNETVILPMMQANMVNYEIEVNNRFISRQRADGLLIATPTGSTAYALSAGGPIIHPQLEATLLIPMFPHTLSSRPLVLSDQSKINVKVSDSRGEQMTVNCDGRAPFVFSREATVHIQQYKHSLTLLHPQSYDYFKTLREKLAWHR